MTSEVPINYAASGVRQVSVRGLDEEKVMEAVRQAEEGMTEEEIETELGKTFQTAALPFVKGKVEKALRRNGKTTPRSRLENEDTTIQTSMQACLTAACGKGSQIIMACPA